MRANIIIGYLTGTIYLLASIVIGLSILNDTNSYFMNSIIAIFALFFSGLILSRTFSMSKILLSIIKKDKYFKRFSISDALIQLTELLFGTLIFCLAFYRTWFEGLAVFD